VNLMKAVKFSLILIAVSSLLVCTAVAEKRGKSVVVKVRSLAATDMYKPSYRQSVNRKIVVGHRIRDLKSKLEKFYYQKYRLLGKRKEVVPISSRRTLNLVDGHTLTVRPMYIEEKRVGMWLRWNDNKGVNVLDTRMHFDSGEPMLTGTDLGGGKGLILAISVSALAKTRK